MTRQVLAVLLGALFAFLCPLQAQTQPRLVLQSGKDPVADVAWSADGKFLATCSFDGTVKLWDATSGRLLKTYSGHQGLVLGVSFSPNGRYLASVGQDRTLKLWELPTNTPVRQFAGHTGPVQSLAVTTDGKILATASVDGTVKLWDVAGGKETATLQAGSPLRSVRFSPNAAIVVAGGDDRILRVWNRADGKLQSTAEGHVDAILATAVHANNQQVLTAGRDGQIKLWLLPIPAPRTIGGHGAAVLALALSPDGARVVSGGADNSVRLHVVANGNQERTFGGFSQPVTAVGYSANGQQIAAGSQSGAVRIYNAGNAQELGFIGAHMDRVTSVAFHAGGQLLLTTSRDGTAKLWKLPVPGVKTAALPAEPVTLRRIPGRPQLAAALASGDIVLLNQADGKPVRSIKAFDAGSVAVAPVPSAPVVFALGANKEVVRCNADNGQVDYRFSLGEREAGALAASPDGSLVAVALANGHIALFSGQKAEGETPESPEPSREIAAHEGAVTAVAFTPDGKHIVSGGADGLVRLWKVEDGSKVAESPNLGQPLVAVRLSDDGNVIVAVSEGGTVAKLNPADLKETMRIQVPATKPIACGLTPDGQRAVLTAETGRNLVLDLQSGKVLQWYDKEGSVAAAPGTDPNSFLVVSKDKNVAIVPLALDTVVYAGAAAATDGTLLTNGRAVVALDSGEVILWDPLEKKELLRLAGHQGGTTAVAATKDSKHLVTGGRDKAVRVWDVRERKATVTIDSAHESDITGVAFSPDETRLVSTDATGVTRIWDISGQAPVLLQTYRLSGPAHDVVFLPDNKSVLAAAEDKNMYVYSLGVGQRYVGHKGAVRALAFHPSGTNFVSGGDDTVIRLWKTADGTLQGEWKGHSGAINGLAYSPNGAMVASGSDDGAVRVWNAASGDQITVWSDNQGKVTAVSFSFDNRLVASATDQGQVTLWSLADNAPVQRFQAPAAVRDIAFLPDNRTVLAACENNAVLQFSLASDTPRNLTGHGDIVDTVAFNPDGTVVATGAYDKTVRLWDPEGAKQIRQIAADTTRAVYAVVFTPDGQTLIAGGTDSIIKAFNVANGQELRRYTGHQDGVFGLAVSSDGQFLASGGPDKTVRIWNLPAGVELHAVSNIPGWIYDVEFARSNRRVFVGDYSGTVTVLDVANGEKIGAFELPTEARPRGIYHLALSPDGTLLAAACADGNAYVFELPEDWR